MVLVEEFEDLVEGGVWGDGLDGVEDADGGDAGLESREIGVLRLLIKIKFN